MVHRWVVLGLTMATALLSGCGSMRALCPLEGGRPWMEVKSPHFRLRTNMDADTAVKTTGELEYLRKGLLQAWGDGFDPPGLVEVIVLSNASELTEFTATRIEGFAGATSEGPVLFLVGNSYGLIEAPTDMAIQSHELTHYLSQFALVRQPRWLSEGLASYLETIFLRPKKKQVILGNLHLGFFEYVRRHGWLSLDELWDWDRKEGLGSAESVQHYASSWLWVHFFISRYPERFTAFQEGLIRGDDPKRAWEVAFSGIRDLAGEVRAYALGTAHTTYPTIVAPLQPQPLHLVTQEVEPAEVHAIRAMLFLMTPGKEPTEERQEKAKKEVVQALKEDPGNVAATLLWVRTSDDPQERLRRARRLVELRPTSGQAWDLLAQSMDEAGNTSEEQEAARLRALELRPESVTTQSGLAGYYARTAQPQKGLEAARRAVALSPGNSAVLDTYANILFQLGRCPEALAAQQRAAEMMYESSSERLRQTVNEALARYEATCGTPAATR